MMKNSTILFILCLLAVGYSNYTVSTVDRIPSDSINSSYASVIDPMAPQSLLKLPAGTIVPKGWILKQLELDREGMLGHINEISRFLVKDNDNAWLSESGSIGWEEMPYWLRGYSELSYLLRDEKMIDETKFWIDAIIASQDDSGNFGPYFDPRKSTSHANRTRMIEGKKQGCQDYWPNMICLWILQNWYEFSKDERVIPFMQKYFHYLAEVPDDELFASFWENLRFGDHLWSVVWLYSVTKEPWLIDLGKKIHAAGADWTSQAIPNWHNVNLAQGFREPATYYLFSKDSSDLAASYYVHNTVRNCFGQYPGGMFGGDENCRAGFTDPRQGIEVCGMVEQIASDGIMLQITSDPFWAENCENVVFNTLPAAMLEDHKGIRYLTPANIAVSDSKNHAPGIENAGKQFAFSPTSYRCCQHNHGMGWSYYASYLMMATPDNGVAIPMYNSCEAKIRVGQSGSIVSLSEETLYPFEETVSLIVSPESAMKFPLYLRIPSWCKNPSIRINGKKVSHNLSSGSYARINRVWEIGDKVEITFPMDINLHYWHANNDAVSVEYGPISLSLKIPEEYKDTVFHSTGKGRPRADIDTVSWHSHELLPLDGWNYALSTDSRISVVKKAWPKDNSPFSLETTPLEFKAKGCQVPSWDIDRYGLTGLIPSANSPQDKDIVDLTLVPMGAARLRISAFPQCSTNK